MMCQLLTFVITSTYILFFFFNDTATTEIYTLSPHDALPILLLTGEMIDAETAEHIGLVNRVVEPEALDETVYKMAATIAGKSGYTQKIGKEAFYRQLEMPLADAYDYTARVMATNMTAEDAQEGISAFLDKRDPNWQHK